MDPSPPQINLTIVHRGVSHALSFSPEDPLDVLHTELAALTNVPQQNQKLLFKGKNIAARSEGDIVTLAHAGLRDGARVQLLGATDGEIGGLRKAEGEMERRERIMRERALKAPVKLRSTGTASTSTHQYRFHTIAALPLPSSSTALGLLNRLADDPGIKHVMNTHRLSIGLLTELAPDAPARLLGLNENAGQAIRLRLRTHAGDGFRPYLMLRRVLCHELAHNRWGDHDENFKQFDSQLTREVAAHERTLAQSSHRLDGGDVYEPGEVEAEMYTLGGCMTQESHTHAAHTPQSGGSAPESAQERRRRAADAALARMREDISKPAP
ncbi:WLM-domain-containing protein [Infundibulicybe gibba]|nr:WLM-domain-containing protein [Infundibulicybe gibba]